MQPVFVGDVQGCAEELDEVLERARSAWGEAFELWVVGDAVNRGPRSLDVLRRIRDLCERGRARYVLGNHEITLVETALGLRRGSRTDTFADVLDAPDLDDWIDFLCSRPLVESGALGDHPFAMVHASAHPGWSLAQLLERAEAVRLELSGSADRARAFLVGEGHAALRDVMERLTTCRSVSGDEWSPSPPEAGFVAWHRDWSRANHGYGVVYGHWSMQGLHVAPRLRGLDTGCVHHGRDGARWLTAWIPDPRDAHPFDVPDTAFWKIPAKRVYHAASGDNGAKRRGSRTQT